MRWNEIDEPEVGAGEPLTPETAPELLFHGTNPIAAAAILRKGVIEADFPVDDDDLGAVVCTTSEPRMAQMFAIEFARLNSEYEVGAVFAINPKALLGNTAIIPYHADTASENEFEFRVRGDIPKSAIVGVKIVGDRSLLDDEDYVDQLCSDAMRFGVRISPADIEALKNAA